MNSKAIFELFILLSCLFIVACASPNKLHKQDLEKGKKIAFTRSKGNCLACHLIADGELPGNLAPELKNISQRFKNQQQLHQFIWDARVFNSETIMPPFGKNKILSEQEIDDLVDYLWQL